MIRHALGLVLAASVLVGCSSGEPAVDEDRVVLTPAAEGAGHTHGRSGAGVRIGDGTSAQAGGYRLTDVTLPEPGEPGDVSFRIVDAGGEPLVDYTPEQTKDLHLYVVRTDLADFRHLHPTLAPDGTWTARVALATPGSYRVLAEFTPATPDADGSHVVLGETQLVPGRWDPVTVSDAASADDGVVAVRAPATLTAGPDERMQVTVSDVGGQRVALGSYLGTFAHLTGFDTATGEFVHAHPFGAAEPGEDGDVLTFHTEFDQPGTYKFFLQVRVDGFVHQVPFAATVA